MGLRAALQVHRRLDREAHEERHLVGIVVDQVDAHRQPLDNLHEVARRVLRGQQCQGGTRAHREPGDAPLEALFAAVHVQFQVHALADAQVAQLRFLEVGVDPDVPQRAQRHEALADLHVVAGVDVAARDHAVDLGDDVQ